MNRRSETHIIQFNNQLFQQAVGQLNERHLQELKESCYPLQNAYADIVQESPRTQQRGYVQGTFLDADNEAEYTQQTLQALGQEVNRLIDEFLKTVPQ